MRVTSLEKLDGSDTRYRLHFDQTNSTEATVLRHFTGVRTFEADAETDEWWLFHLEQPIMGRTFTMILVNRDGNVSVPRASGPFTLKPRRRDGEPPC